MKPAAPRLHPRRLLLAGLGPLMIAPSLAGCASSVVAREERGVRIAVEALEWRTTTAADVPGTYVSTELRGPLAASLRKLVYLFLPDGTYTGAALLDDGAPHFEVVTGTWAVEAGLLRLDGGPPGTLEAAEDGSLRLAGDEGVVLLRKEPEL